MCSSLFFPPSFIVLLAALVGFVQAGDGCEASNAKAVRSIRFKLPLTPNSMESQTVSSWSKGGGPRGIIPSNVADLTNPFAGREYASGNRDNILGTRAYGSGYPYGVSDTSTIRGRPFPHGMWPISWGPGYLGGDEYWGDDLDLIRPGGELGIVSVSTKLTDEWPTIGDNEVYTIIGDKESLTFMISDLVRICFATPAWPRAFDPLANSSFPDLTHFSSLTSYQPKPENVIQYYRSSSFALAYYGYNNTFALPSSNLTTNHDSLSLPYTIAESPFLHCINDTIRASLTLLDPLQQKKPLSKGAIAGIVIGSVAGAVLAVLYGWAVCSNDQAATATTTNNQMDESQAVPGSSIPLLTVQPSRDEEASKMSDIEQGYGTKDENKQEDANKNDKNVVYV